MPIKDEQKKKNKKSIKSKKLKKTKQKKHIKILKKSTGPIPYYKPKTVKIKPNLNRKKSSQTGLN